jgi:hypothetical protein
MFGRNVAASKQKSVSENDQASRSHTKKRSTCQENSFPTGLVCERQQKVHLFAQAREGVISMH